jgi:hypothetical protein
MAAPLDEAVAPRPASDIIRRRNAYLKYFRLGGFWPFRIGMSRPPALR